MTTKRKIIAYGGAVLLMLFFVSPIIIRDAMGLRPTWWQVVAFALPIFGLFAYWKSYLDDTRISSRTATRERAAESSSTPD